MRLRLAQDAMAFVSPASTNVRLLVAEGSVRSRPQHDIYCAWSTIQPGSIPPFSAIGLAFGDALQKRLGIPVGLIQATAVGSLAESWIPHANMATHPELRDATDAFDQALRDHGASLEAWVGKYEDWRRETDERDVAGLQGLPMPAMPAADPRVPPSRPAGLFNGTIAPFTRLPVKGVIWHGDAQGVAHSSRNQALSTALVEGWRKAWNMDTLPFLLIEDGGSDDGQGNAAGAAAPPTAFIVAVGELQGPDRTVRIGERLAETAVRSVYSMER
jgi:sialate O-acetylesterase